MQGKMHRIRSLTPLQAAGNALAMHVQIRVTKGSVPVPEPKYSYIATCWKADNCANQVHEVVNSFQDKFKELGAKVAVRKIMTVCSGHCKKGVFADLGGSVFYERITLEDVASVVKDTILEGDILPAHFSMERSILGEEKVIYDRSANVLIYSDPEFRLAEGLRDLLQKEGLSSCGKCVPCRLGVKKINQMLGDLLAGKARGTDMERLRELAVVMDISSRCALASKFVGPLFVAMDHFGEELNFVCVLGDEASHVCKLKEEGSGHLAESA